MATITQQYAKFITGSKFEDMPADSVNDIKMRVLDSLGIMIAANRLNTSKIAKDVVGSISGPGECTVVGSGEQMPLANVTLINSVMAHSYDFDDTNTSTLIHASASIIPTTLAVGEALKVSGKDLILLAALGYEISLRMGLAKPRGVHARGFHSTSVFNVFGAAAIAAKGMKLTEQETVWALGNAASFASGLLCCLKDGTDIKIFHAGWAGHGGIIAAKLAQAGMTGPAKVVEGELGFFDAYLHGEEYSTEALVEGLGTIWKHPTTAFKLYPSCHFTHAYIDCAKNLKKRHNIDYTKIKSIELLVPAGMVPIVLEPKADKQAPATEYGQRFSLYYNIAAALLEDKITINTLSADKLTDERYLTLAKKTDYTLYDFENFPEWHPGWVKITMESGEVYEDRMKSCRGPFGEPIVFADIEEKFRGNTEGVLAPEKIDEIVDFVKNLEKQTDIKHLLSLTKI